MTTGNFENWTGEIADIGPVYPFVGTEMWLVVAGVVFWIGWHIVQCSAEVKSQEEGRARAREHVSRMME